MDSTSTAKNALCPGCKKYFTYSGLSRHLAQTYDIRCTAARLEMDRHGRQRAKELDSQSDEDNEPPTRFQGDFFGNDYQDEDFGWDEEDIPQEGDDISDNISDDNNLSIGNDSVENSNIDNTDEPEWEPPVVEADEGLATEDDTTEGENVEMLNEDPIQARDEAEKGILRKPVIVHFSKGKAGQVLFKTQDQHSVYQDAIGAGNGNPYEPFTSKLD